MRLNIRSARTLGVIIALAILLWLPCADRSDASTQSNVSSAASIRREGCGELQSGCDQIVAAHPNDPAVAAFVRQLAALDAAADDTFHDLRGHRAAFLDRNLANISGASADPDGPPVLLGAAAIIEKHAASFAHVPSSSDLPEADRQVMAQYLNAAADVLARAVQSRAQACMALAGPDSAEVLRLALVLPVLRSDPSQSLTEPAAALPAWMSGASALHVLREFAVEASRPRLAFALARTSTTAASVDPSASYLAFVAGQADAMSRIRRYAASLAALRDGISVASAVNDQSTVTKLSFRVAEVLESSASPKAAADEIQSMRSRCVDPADYSQASVLYLKYLYLAGQYSALVSGARADLGEPRCQSALPQIIYITWATCRRHGMDASPWNKTFIDRFPDDPLAAQMYLASALDAIAQGKPQEASRLLEFIEHRFPRSKIIPRVRQVRARLRAVDSTSLSPDQGNDDPQQH
jgi:hypothetical protein